MTFEETSLSGLYLITPFSHEDSRGSFVKPFRKKAFEEKGLDTDFRELYYSESVKGVIRGMHFQLPPEDHNKIVFCTSGEVLDVVLDLRKDSGTYGKYQTFHLSATNRYELYIPKGVAHGFCSISDKATLVYLTSTEHSPANDTGVRYDSFGFQWPVADPILSPRDRDFPSVENFVSPFGNE